MLISTLYFFRYFMDYIHKYYTTDITYNVLSRKYDEVMHHLSESGLATNEIQIFVDGWELDNATNCTDISNAFSIACDGWFMQHFNDYNGTQQEITWMMQAAVRDWLVLKRHVIMNQSDETLQ